MSKRRERVATPNIPAFTPAPFAGGAKSCVTLPGLIILILVILQFSKGKGHGFKDIDKSLLFIIALFFLSCCNPCKG